jgi:hypothetical protein
MHNIGENTKKASLFRLSQKLLKHGMFERL